METSPSDEKLLQRVTDGDRDAFATLYDRHAGRVLGLLLRIVGNRGVADDLLQDVFLQVWRRAASFDPLRGGVLPWLFVIARSRAYDYWRRPTANTGFDATDAADSEHQEPPGDSIEHAELAGQASAALAMLPAPQREMIQLAFYEGWSHAEIARTRRLALGTVKTRIRSGMRRLRELLVTNEHGEYA